MDLAEDDLELAVAARNGDEAAFSELVRRHTPRLLLVAELILGDRASAEDAVQDGVTQGWRGVAKFRGDAAFGTWMHRIVVRCALAGLRDQHRMEKLIDAERRFMDPAYTVDPADVVTRANDSEQLRRALDTLSGVYRVSVVLHDVEGMTASEVAGITGVPLGTAKGRIRRGRIALLAELARSAISRNEAEG
ncbi:MAG: RNA polymerase sigma factor [Acidimicrobiales bacterium]